ncbi:hypothetical protein B4903_12965 [Yersinia frederiksenii]|nr:hypothetical protein B4903_12965 [Yersinia frederiksenii]
MSNKNKVEPWARDSNDIIDGHSDNVSTVYHKLRLYGQQAISSILLFSILSNDIANEIDRVFMSSTSLLLGTLHDLFHNIDAG